jgi:hypothetical protein
MGGMALSDKETRILINYVRRKFAEERWPLSPALRPVREIMNKLDPKTGASAVAGTAGRAKLTDGQEAEALTRH